MNLNRKIFVAVFTTVVLSMAGCSSSNSDDNATQQPQSDTGPDTPSDQTQDGTTTDPANGTPTDSINLRTLSNDILLSLAGYDLELFSEEVALLADRVVFTASSVTSLPDTSVELIHRNISQSYPVANVLYDCAQGGSLTTSTLAVDVTVAEEIYNSVTNSVTYLFDQCQLTADNGPTVNGTMIVAGRDVILFRANTTERTFNWESFQWQQQSGEQTININASIRSFTEVDESNTEIRDVSIAEHIFSNNGVLTSGVQNSRFLVSSIDSDGGVFDFTLDTAGDFIDPSGTRIAVLANPALNSKIVSPGPLSASEQSVPFNGRITFSASDGSMLDMVGNGATDDGARLVDFTHTDQNGEVSTLVNQELLELNVFLE
ncbi:MAG: hypothetical protein AB8B64_22170 [Granulosicoccus sp.]